jgi:phosphate acetyltransferase
VTADRLPSVKEHLKALGLEKEPIYILPEEPILGKPTVGEIARNLDAQILQGDAKGLNREVQHHPGKPGDHRIRNIPKYCRTASDRRIDP